MIYNFTTGLTALFTTLTICSTNGICNKVKTQIDTGATNTTIDTSIVKKFNMTQKGTIKSCSIGGKCYKEPYYDMYIFLNNKVLPTLKISSGKVDLNDGVKLLIGMDFLSMCDMTLDSNEKEIKVSIMYPANNYTID